MVAASIQPLNAQSKISAAGQLWLNENRAAVTRQRVHVKNNAAADEPAASILVIATFAPGYSSRDIDIDGVEIRDERAGMAIISVPVDAIEELAGQNAIATLDFGGMKEVSMDFARTSANIDAVTTGSGLTSYGDGTTFTGKGVITGLMDSGIDPNHANFKDADGNLRVKRVYSMSGNDGKFHEYSTPTDIADFTTENDEETHGTHVAGIMAGGFRDRLTKYVKMPQGDSPNGFAIPIRAAANPFYGVAYESDIAMAAGTLSDANIVEGVRQIVEYAKSEGKPVVVNLSLGSTTGPHDGTDGLSRYLDSFAEDAVICVSAGNDGDYPIHISKDFTGSDTEVKTFAEVNTAAVSNNTMSGWVDTWSADATPLDITVDMYDTTTGKSLGSISTKGATGVVSMCSSAYSRYGYTYNSVFNTYFNGYVQMLGMLDSSNNRYNVRISITAIPASTNVALAVTAEGKEGQHIDMYGSTRVILSDRSMAGWSAGSPDGSLNDMACGENLICVGSYTTRNYWGTLNGSKLSRIVLEKYPIEGISPFSSYGKTFQGVARPDICAPGAGIISSYSTPFITKNISNPDNTYCAKLTSGSRTDYWGEMDGTSMSCPVVSGVMALWLKAEPTLKAAGIKRIFASTAKNDTHTADAPERWGAGKIDALEGMKYILDGKAAIGTVWADADERLVVTPVADGYEVFVAGETNLSVTLHDMQGRAVATARGADGKATVVTSGLARGIYVLSVQGSTGRLTRKVTKL